MELLAVDDATTLDRTAAHLAAGGVAIVPTDTVYGLVAALDHPEAVARLADLKGRPGEVPIAVLVADAAQAATVAELTVPGRALARRWWPGALTLVLPARSGVDRVVGSRDRSVGVRAPDDGFVQALVARVGPIAATSANRHGDPTPPTAAGAARALAGIAVVVDGGRRGDLASTVADVRGPGDPVVLRKGGVRIS